MNEHLQSIQCKLVYAGWIHLTRFQSLGVGGWVGGGGAGANGGTPTKTRPSAADGADGADPICKRPANADTENENEDVVHTEDKLQLAIRLANGDSELAKRALGLKQTDKNRWKDKMDNNETCQELKNEWAALGELGHGRNKKLSLVSTSVLLFSKSISLSLYVYIYIYILFVVVFFSRFLQRSPSSEGGHCGSRKQALMTAANTIAGMEHPFLQRKVELQRQSQFKDKPLPPKKILLQRSNIKNNYKIYFWTSKVVSFSFFWYLKHEMRFGSFLKLKTSRHNKQQNI